MLKAFIYSISILFFIFFFKYLMFPNYKDKGIYLEYKSYKEYTVRSVWSGGCELLEMALIDDGYYGKLGGDGQTYEGMYGDEKEYLSCQVKYILYSNNGIDSSIPDFYHNKSELELKIGKYKAKRTEDVIKSMKRRYSIE